MHSDRLNALLRKEMSRKDFLGFTALAVVSLFGVSGVITELLSHAATPYASEEAEQGMLTGGALKRADTTASDGSSVQFGSSVSAVTTLPYVGIATGSPVVDASDHGLAQYSRMKSLGINIVRIETYYTLTDTQTADATIQAALSVGLEVLILLNHWNTNDQPVMDFATFATNVAITYAPLGVHAYEILNEVNLYSNWDTTNDYVNPANYTILLKAAYGAIKAIDPKSVILFSSLAPTANGALVSDGNYARSLSVVPFVAAAYVAMGGDSTGYFDAMGSHPYTYPSLPSTTSGNFYLSLSPTGATVRSAMIANGDTAKPMWITEFGAPTGSDDGITNYVTQAVQSQTYTTAFSLITSNSWAYVQTLCAFSWQDDGAGDFGLNYSDFSPKPALNAYLNAAGLPSAPST
jgi:hypothetical protein